MEQILVIDTDFSNNKLANGKIANSRISSSSSTGLTLTWENVNAYLPKFHSRFANMKSKLTGDKTEINLNRQIIDDGIY